MTSLSWLLVPLLVFQLINAQDTSTTKPPSVTVTRPGGGYYKCPDDKQTGQFPITNGTCSPQYYNCKNGDAYLQDCPPNSLFDPQQNLCLRSDEVVCGFRCPPENDGYGFYAIPEKCVGEYYICFSFNVYDSKCPGTAIFDPVLGICLSQSNPELSCRPDNVSVCDNKRDRFSYHGSCSLYYDCSSLPNDILILSQCSLGNVFNPVTGACEVDKGQVVGCDTFNLTDFQKESLLVKGQQHSGRSLISSP